jgi:large subunit ribosomal protein L15
VNISDVLAEAGKRPARKRRGRGQGSGLGKTAGRGHKGAHARAGWSRRLGYEGGQMPITRRVPKRGFSNAPFRRRYDIVNLTVLESRFEAGEVVSLESLKERGILKPAYGRLKVLGTGELTKPLKVMAHHLSESARQKVDAAGGSVEVLKFAAADSRRKIVARKKRSKPPARQEAGS